MSQIGEGIADSSSTIKERPKRNHRAPVKFTLDFGNTANFSDTTVNMFKRKAEASGRQSPNNKENHLDCNIPSSQRETTPTDKTHHENSNELGISIIQNSTSLDKAVAKDSTLRSDKSIESELESQAEIADEYFAEPKVAEVATVVSEHLSSSSDSRAPVTSARMAVTANDNPLSPDPVSSSSTSPPAPRDDDDRAQSKRKRKFTPPLAERLATPRSAAISAETSVPSKVCGQGESSSIADADDEGSEDKVEDGAEPDNRESSATGETDGTAVGAHKTPAEKSVRRRAQSEGSEYGLLDPMTPLTRLINNWKSPTAAAVLGIRRQSKASHSGSRSLKRPKVPQEIADSRSSPGSALETLADVVSAALSASDVANAAVTVASSRPVSNAPTSIVHAPTEPPSHHVPVAAATSAFNEQNVANPVPIPPPPRDNSGTPARRSRARSVTHTLFPSPGWSPAGGHVTDIAAAAALADMATAGPGRYRGGCQSLPGQDVAHGVHTAQSMHGLPPLPVQPLPMPMPMPQMPMWMYGHGVCPQHQQYSLSYNYPPYTLHPAYQPLPAMFPHMYPQFPQPSPVHAQSLPFYDMRAVPATPYNTPHLVRSGAHTMATPAMTVNSATPQSHFVSPTSITDPAGFSPPTQYPGGHMTYSMHGQHQPSQPQPQPHQAQQPQAGYGHGPMSLYHPHVPHGFPVTPFTSPYSAFYPEWYGGMSHPFYAPQHPQSMSPPSQLFHPFHPPYSASAAHPIVIPGIDGLAPVSQPQHTTTAATESRSHNEAPLPLFSLKWGLIPFMQSVLRLDSMDSTGGGIAATTGGSGSGGGTCSSGNSWPESPSQQLSSLPSAVSASYRYTQLWNESVQAARIILLQSEAVTGRVITGCTGSNSSSSISSSGSGSSASIVDNTTESAVQVLDIVDAADRGFPFGLLRWFTGSVLEHYLLKQILLPIFVTKYGEHILGKDLGTVLSGVTVRLFRVDPETVDYVVNTAAADSSDNDGSSGADEDDDEEEEEEFESGMLGVHALRQLRRAAAREGGTKKKRRTIRGGLSLFELTVSEVEVEGAGNEEEEEEEGENEVNFAVS